MSFWVATLMLSGISFVVAVLIRRARRASHASLITRSLDRKVSGDDR